MIVLLAVSYLGILYFTWRFRDPIDGTVSFVAFFGLSGFYYYIAVPLELYLRGQESLGNHIVGLVSASPSVGAAVGIMANLALIGFVSGIWLSGFRSLVNGDGGFGIARRPPRSMLVLVATSLLLMGVTGLSKLAVLLTGYHEKARVLSGDGVFAQLLQYLLTGLLILAVHFMVQKKQRSGFGIAIVVGVAIFGIGIGDKNPIVQACCALAAVATCVRLPFNVTAVAMSIAMCVAVLLMPVFSQFRSGRELRFENFSNEYSVLKTDAVGPAYSFFITISEGQKLGLGETYFRAVTALVPKQIWPERQLDLAEEFARNNIRAEQWFDGAGLGYSPLAEAYVNFGIWGGYFHFLLLGFIFGFFWRIARQVCRAEGLFFWRALYSVIGLYSIMLMHRAPLNGMLRFILYNSAVPVCLYILYDRRDAGKKTPTGRVRFGGIQKKLLGNLVAAK